MNRTVLLLIALIPCLGFSGCGEWCVDVLITEEPALELLFECAEDTSCVGAVLDQLEHPHTHNWGLSDDR